MQKLLIKLVEFRSDHKHQDYSGNKKEMSLLLGLMIEIWPGLASLKCCDYLKMCAISDVVAILAQVVADISPLLICSGYRCWAWLFQCVPNKIQHNSAQLLTPHIRHWWQVPDRLNFQTSPLAHCCRPFSHLQPGSWQRFPPCAEAAASPSLSLFPFPAPPGSTEVETHHHVSGELSKPQKC